MLSVFFVSSRHVGFRDRVDGHRGGIYRCLPDAPAPLPGVACSGGNHRVLHVQQVPAGGGTKQERAQGTRKEKAKVDL